MSILLKNIRISFIEHLILSSNVLITIPFIRYLGPERYGTYSYYLSLAYLFSVLTFVHFESLVVKELSQTESRNELIFASLVLNIIGSFFVFLSFFIYYEIYKDVENISELYIVLVALTSYNSVRNTLKIAFVAKQRIGIVAKLNITLFAISSAMKILGIVLKQELDFFFYLMVIDSILGVGLFSIYFYKEYKFNSNNLIKHIHFLFKHGWPLLLTGLSVLIFMKIDQLMLYHMRGSHDAGLYASMMWIMEKFYIFIGILLQALYPYLSEKYTTNKKQYHLSVKIGYKVLSLFVIPIIVFIFFYHQVLVMLLLGEKYAEASHTLAILICSLPFVFWGALNQRTLVITHALKLDLIFASLSALLNVVLNFLFIPLFGIAGAAIATFAAHSLYFWMQIFIKSRRLYSKYILYSIPVPLFSSLICIGIINAFDFHVLFKLVIYALIYVLIVLIYSRSKWAFQYGAINRLFLQKFIK